MDDRRRELEFDSLDDAVAEAERLAQSEVRTTGNHSFGQIIEHLARTHDMATGKTVGPRPPFVVRLLMPVLRGGILRGPVKPGYKLPSDAESFLWPGKSKGVKSKGVRPLCLRLPPLAGVLGDGSLTQA